MKKILSVILMITLIATVAAASVTAAGAADLPILNSYDVSIDFEDFALTKGDKIIEKEAFPLENGTKSNLIVHYEYTQTDVMEIVEDPFGTGKGKMLHFVNNVGINGTYANVSYLNPTSPLVARNFTITYDMYANSGDETSSPWTSIIGRMSTPGITYDHTYCVAASIQNGKGTSADTLRNGRTAVSSDIYYQYVPATCVATASQTRMQSPSSINKPFNNWYKTEGGGVRDTWYNIKIEFREQTIAFYMREDGSGEEYHLCGIAYYQDINNLIYAGTFAIAQCAGDYYYDNINFVSEDGNQLSTACESVAGEPTTDISIPKDAGTAYATQYTAGDATEIELVMSGYDGYVFGKWYKDEAKTEVINPTKFTLQRYTEDVNYGKYEWLDVKDEMAQIDSYDDMFATIEVDGEEVIWNEYYAGSKYRLLVRTNTATDGFDYYGEFVKQQFTVSVSNDGNGSVEIDGFEDVDGVMVSRLELDQTATLKAVPKTGYQFAGWYEEVVVNGVTYVKRMSTDDNFIYTHKQVNPVNIKAVFVESVMGTSDVNMTTMIIQPGDHKYGSIIAGPGTYFYGEEISLIVSENAGYSFIGFFVGEYNPEDKSNQIINTLDEEVFLYVPYTVEGDVDIVAVYEVETYRVYITDGLDGDDIIRDVEKGSSVTLTAAAAPVGYKFDGWIVQNATYTQVVANRTVSFDATNRNIYAIASYSALTSNIKISYSNKDVVVASIDGNRTYGSQITITPKFKEEGWCVSRYTVKGADATINEDGTLSFTLGENDVTIRIEVMATDEIQVDEEILMYIVFMCVGIVIVFALLFANNKDKREQRQ